MTVSNEQMIEGAVLLILLATLILGAYEVGSANHEKVKGDLTINGQLTLDDMTVPYELVYATRDHHTITVNFTDRMVDLNPINWHTPSGQKLNNASFDRYLVPESDDRLDFDHQMSIEHTDTVNFNGVTYNPTSRMVRAMRLPKGGLSIDVRVLTGWKGRIPELFLQTAIGDDVSLYQEYKYTKICLHGSHIIRMIDGQHVMVHKNNDHQTLHFDSNSDDEHYLWIGLIAVDPVGIPFMTASNLDLQITVNVTP